MEIGFVYPGWINARSEIARTDGAAIACHLPNLSEQLDNIQFASSCSSAFLKNADRLGIVPA